MSKIFIANVLYTNSDETFYVLTSEHEDASKYQADTKKQVIKNLESGGFNYCGRVNKSDNSLADMFTDSRENYLAIWEE